MDGMMYGGGGLTPEQQQAFMEYAAGQGAFAEQDREVQRQLAAAQALRNRGPSQHSTGIGGGLGAIGDILGSYVARRDMKSAQAQDTAMQQARIAALRQLASKYGAGQPQPQQPDPLAGVPFGAPY